MLCVWVVCDHFRNFVKITNLWLFVIHTSALLSYLLTYRQFVSSQWVDISDIWQLYRQQGTMTRKSVLLLVSTSHRKRQQWDLLYQCGLTLTFILMEMGKWPVFVIELALDLPWPVRQVADWLVHQFRLLDFEVVRSNHSCTTFRRVINLSTE